MAADKKFLQLSMPQTLRHQRRKRVQPLLLLREKLQTPPRVENKGQKKRKLVTGGNAAPVPGFGKKEGAEYPFKGPEGGMAYLEKPIPELRAVMGDRMEQSRQHFHPQSSKIKEEVADDDGDNEDDSLSVSEGRAERKKRPFKRKCWKKVPTSTERQRKAFGAWLAHKGLKSSS